MTDLGDAIANKMADAWSRQPAPFEPDEELERVAERMQTMREHSPKEFADANFGGLRQRVDTYLRRKAAHEKENNA